MPNLMPPPHPGETILDDVLKPLNMSVNWLAKPRPAVVVQSNLFNGTHSSVVVCPIAGHLEDAPFFAFLCLPGE